jgi:hypothetical protein
MFNSFSLPSKKKKRTPRTTQIEAKELRKMTPISPTKSVLRRVGRFLKKILKIFKKNFTFCKATYNIQTSCQKSVNSRVCTGLGSKPFFTRLSTWGRSTIRCSRWTNYNRVNRGFTLVTYYQCKYSYFPPSHYLINYLCKWVGRYES